VRGADIAPGPAPDQAPQLAILFLDENRATVDTWPSGHGGEPSSGNGKTGRIKVPLHAGGDRQHRTAVAAPAKYRTTMSEIHPVKPRKGDARRSEESHVRRDAGHGGDAYVE